MKTILFLTLLCCTVPLKSETNITYQEIDETLRDVLKFAFDASQPLKKLIAHSVRLIFHDCGGPSDDGTEVSICNGCIDFNNNAHAGLVDFAVMPLEDIYQGITNCSTDLGDFNGANLCSPDNIDWSEKMSRADFWAITATIAIQYAHKLALGDDEKPNSNIENIPFWIDRIDCDGPDTGDVSSATAATPKAFPDAVGSFQEATDWFLDNFGMTERETVALVGAHTLGRMHVDASGFGKSNTGVAFWVPAWDELDNEFYKAIKAGGWVQERSSAKNGDGDDVQQWTKGAAVMLNTDIGMWIDLEEAIDIEATGTVGCDFADCTEMNETKTLVELYADNNDLWLNDFAAAFEEMITAGYELVNLTILEGPDTSESSTTEASEEATTTEFNDSGAENKFNWSWMMLVAILYMLYK